MIRALRSVCYVWTAATAVVLAIDAAQWLRDEWDLLGDTLKGR